MVEKTIDRSNRMEYSEPAESQVDKLVYEIGRLISSDSPSAPFLEEVVNSLRTDELRLPPGRGQVASAGA